MIPSLVAAELQQALIEYLATTFAISDDAASQALTRFLHDERDGIFRGPFLRVRTPFRSAPNNVEPPLDWLPAGFRPYLHQLRAFERLSSRERLPQPTLVTTGTGSGKTESFLLPVLDHCRRQRALGKPGLKALILYPMNALASDQARRIADLLHDEPSLAGVTAALYVGQGGGNTIAGGDHLVDDRHAIRRNPPDILLTNYKMLDLLLLRAEDRPLFAGASASLQYVVLDEFHTYDGAQGTDVAMLLRRLGAATGVAEPGRSLGNVTPIGTSATLGAGTSAADEICRFATRVFGVPFATDAIIGEDRLSIDEACDHINYDLPIPGLDEVLDVDLRQAGWADTLASLFCGRVPASPEELGDLLREHTLTRGVLSAGTSPSEWMSATSKVVERAPDWGRALRVAPDKVAEGLRRYMALISLGRRADDRPLFPVEVQLWVREVSRVVRRVQTEPVFRWADSASVDEDGDDQPDEVFELPAIFCRHCGRTGWMAKAGELDNTFEADHAKVYSAAVEQRGRLRALIHAQPDEPDVRWYDPINQRMHVTEKPGSVAVLATSNDDDGARERCPSCNDDEAIRFIGSRVASLASVAVSQLFASGFVGDDERKLLAFTDSVQDASHRAGFFAGRTHRFNARTALAEQLGDEPVTLAQAAGAMLADTSIGRVRAVCPPDLVNHRLVRTLWTDSPEPSALDLIGRRLAFEAALEIGLRSRLGRTLELTGTVAGDVVVAERRDVLDAIRNALSHAGGQRRFDLESPDVEGYLAGLLARIRKRGAIWHPWLDPYILDDGNPWRIWGGRPDGCPAFPKGLSRPTFFSVGKCGDFDDIDSLTKTPSWLVDWATRTLLVEAAEARSVNRATFAILAQVGVAMQFTTTRGVTVYGPDGARGPVKGKRTAHRSSCLVRRSDRDEKWDDLVLFHEMSTEVVRMLVPIQQVDAGERLASFKGALLLGLRKTFGGEADHLRILNATIPGGGGRRRLLIIHDAVPGGTGYLHRLAEPARLRDVLAAARDAIAGCSCGRQGRVACHRCLLGGLNPAEIPLAARSYANDLLDRLLADWALDPIDSVASFAAAGGDDVETERMFRVAVPKWAAGQGDHARAVVRPKQGAQVEIELTVGKSRWRITEQEYLKTTPGCRPDFVLKREDAPGTPIAVFADGFTFHASAENNRLADDAIKRAAARRLGYLVWSLTYRDVEAFYLAATAPTPTRAADSPIITAGQRRVAQAYLNQRALAGLDAPAIDRNPVVLLLDYLADPDNDRWSLLARALITGLAAGSLSPLDEPGLTEAMTAAMQNRSVTPAATGDQRALHATAVTLAGQRVSMFLDTRADVGGPNAERWTVVAALDDTVTGIAHPDHAVRWSDWLHLANLLQFARSDTRDMVLSTVSSTHTADLDELAITPASAPPRSDAAGFDDDVDALLELVGDASRELLRGAIHAGAPPFEPGWETEDDNQWPLDAAWPDQKVAVLIDVVPERDRLLVADGWQSRLAADWDLPGLLRALGLSE